MAELVAVNVATSCTDIHFALTTDSCCHTNGYCLCCHTDSYIAIMFTENYCYAVMLDGYCETGVVLYCYY